MSLEFSVAKRRQEPIPFHFADEPDYQYDFKPQKLAGVVLSLLGDDQAEQVKRVFDWLSDGLPDEQAQHIIDRLNDSEDDLDIPDVVEVIQKLQEEVSGRPTTPTGVSSVSQTNTGRNSTAGARRKVKTPST